MEGFHSPSRAVRRRARSALRERRERWRAERDAFLETQLEPGDPVLAQDGRELVVTDRRILWARQFHQPPRQGEWSVESLRFSEIMGFAIGRQHDRRPLLRFQHAAIERVEHVPAHRLLWFEWGDAEALVEHHETILVFRKDADPCFIAAGAGLARAGVPQGEPFVIRPEGTRAERTKMTKVPYLVSTPRKRLRLQLRRTENTLYRGQLAWRVRLPSWLILAIPAWFIDPWLVIPAVLLAEVGWIVALQWSWHRSRTSS